MNYRAPATGGWTLRAKALAGLVAALLLLALSAPVARAAIIDTIAEDTAEARGVELNAPPDTPTCAKVTTATAPVRAGTTAFRHALENCGRRAEFAARKTAIGGTYWYGWSMYLPADFDDADPERTSTIPMQLATYPTPRDGKFPCGGNGHKISLATDGSVQYHLQHPTATADMVCDRYPLGRIGDWKGRWVDFVLHAKWTGDEDGFLALWTKVGDGDYARAIDYRGPTWWNDEGDGPYFKMGLYTGIYNWKGAAPRVLYTDEYRLGDAASSFDEVRPGGGTAPIAALPRAGGGGMATHGGAPLAPLAGLGLAALGGLAVGGARRRRPQRVADKQVAIAAGREPLGAWEPFVQDWRRRGGDQIRKELEDDLKAG